MDCTCLSSETATEFAISLIQTLVTQDSSSVSELFNVVDVLSKVFMSACFIKWLSPGWLASNGDVCCVPACNEAWVT